MKFYSEILLPKLLNSAMSAEEFSQLRRQTLAQAKGKVLEIGSGSGLNFKHYPATVTKLIALDNNAGMQKLAREKTGSALCPVELVTQSGEELPFEATTFDTVVSTWSLCSIEKVEEALREIRRVLKPDGKFIFIEHGLAPDAKTQVWQKRLNPLQKKLVGNCHLDRSIKQLIEGQAFNFEELKEYYAPKMSKIVGYTYQGIACRV